MTRISAAEILPSNELLALRVLAHARAIAPSLHLLEGSDRAEAIAILQGVATEAVSRGARHVVAQGVGSASVRYGTAASWFTDDDRRALQALGQAATARMDASHPVGSFPAAHRPLQRMWPEENP